MIMIIVTMINVIMIVTVMIVRIMIIIMKRASGTCSGPGCGSRSRFGCTCT